MRPDQKPALEMDECLQRLGQAITERDRQIIALRLSSPKRSPTDQADAGHLPLFVAANEPSLL